MKKDGAGKDVLDLKSGAHIVAPVSVNILHRKLSFSCQALCQELDIQFLRK